MADHRYELGLCGRNLAKARDVVAEHTEYARLTTIAAHAGGMSEVEIARLLGVNRLTVRKWLGK